MTSIRFVAIAVILLFSFACAAPPPRQQTQKVDFIRGNVVAVADGDTLTVLDLANRQHRIRLKGIDAPEGSQAFSAVSRQGLARLTFNKSVEVKYDKTDQYGRVVGQVLLDGKDVNLQLLVDGLAWFYREFANELIPEDRLAYEQAELSARLARRGLWADQNQIPPWEYRRSARTGFATDTTSQREINAIPALRKGEAEPRVIGNRRSRIYKRSNCPNYGDVSPQNRVYFRTTEEAEAAGYRIARNCS
ncbi:MAG: thermonuclease family protein [Acidobacteriota bacterium]|nr:thermonuclease family protein [Acidobacteriota bacterium]